MDERCGRSCFHPRALLVPPPRRGAPPALAAWDMRRRVRDGLQDGGQRTLVPPSPGDRSASSRWHRHHWRLDSGERGGEMKGCFGPWE